MFEFFKSRKSPVKYKSPEEREHYLNDIQKRLSDQYQDVHFKFIILPAISKDATM